MHIDTCWPTGVLPQIGASISAQCERCPHAMIAHSLSTGRCEACGLVNARDALLALTEEAKAYLAARAAGYIVGPDGVPYGPFTEAEHMERLEPDDGEYKPGAPAYPGEPATRDG